MVGWIDGSSVEEGMASRWSDKDSETNLLLLFLLLYYLFKTSSPTFQISQITPTIAYEEQKMIIP